MSFSDLKRKSSNNFQFLQKELEKSSTEQKSGADERLWKPELDASGNGYAVLRFLPAPDGETVPWAKLYSHGFQGPGGWFIENSLTTRGDKDPVSEYNSVLWNNGTEAGKDQARKQKRKLSYYSNIYVVKDPKNPENEGKVFLYRYGKKIFDKIMDLMQPQFPGETPINPFDFWNGADFELKIRNVAGYRNYDKSEFKSTSALYESDETKLEATYNQQYDLNEFVDPANFKTYQELESRLELVLGTAVGANTTIRNEALTQTAEANVGRSAPQPEIVSAPAPAVGAVAQEDDTLSYFAQMAQED